MTNLSRECYGDVTPVKSLRDPNTHRPGFKA